MNGDYNDRLLNSGRPVEVNWIKGSAGRTHLMVLGAQRLNGYIPQPN